MKKFSTAYLAAPAFLTIVLAGCATPQQHPHGRGPAGPGSDMHAMCEMHRNSMAGRSDADRMAMMEERMRSMSPEMRRQMQEMMANCR